MDDPAGSDRPPPTPQAAAPAIRPTLTEATAVWLRIGLLSFGGPAGQIALMHRELVEERRWVSEGRFLNALNFCMILPGPEAQQLATYVGWLLHGTRGGLIAGSLFVLPGLAVMLALSITYALARDSLWIASLFFGLKAAVLAVVVSALLRIAGRALKTPALRAIAAAAFLALYGAQVPFPLVILAAGIAGFLGSRCWPGAFPAAGHGGTASDADDAATGPTDASDRSVRWAVRLLLVWGAVWAAPVVVLAALFGPQSVFVPIAAFFSKMAVVTFGGAYAVLSYVAQQAVDGYGWLGPGEMVDGLALAETTPGPLILVLSFVGFLAAFRDPGGLDPLVAGTIGALLTAWVTFAPCFLWIFLGAPHIERLRHNRPLSAAMRAITAAVVGVILNLTVWFGLHVLFAVVTTADLGPFHPAVPVLSTIDPLAAALAAAALTMMLRFKVGLMPTLAACGLAGLVAAAAGLTG